MSTLACGFSDYAEFIAGTNPNLPNSSLRLNMPLLQNDATVRLQWQSVVGRVYQVQGTLNFSNWLPLTGWIQATGGMTTVTVPPPAPGINHHKYRLEVWP